MEISFIGVGRMGGALALALSRLNYRVKNLVVRSRSAAEKIVGEINPPPQILDFEEIENLSPADLIFITTRDGEIEPAARHLAEKLTFKPCVFHTSGSLSSEILQSLAEKGCSVASLHPLVSISDAHLGAERFKNVFFCIEGDAEATAIAQKIVDDLGGRAFSIETRFKPLYHASAVTSAGHLTALFSVAVEMLSACGLSPSEAQKILLPLARSTIENLSAQTPAAALTGTFARADTETLKKHLKAVRESVSGEARQVYLQLGLRSLHLAQEQGAAEEKLSEMREILRAENK
jgi:Uncharacterized conserved protein